MITGNFFFWRDSGIAFSPILCHRCSHWYKLHLHFLMLTFIGSSVGTARTYRWAFEEEFAISSSSFSSSLARKLLSLGHITYKKKMARTVTSGWMGRMEYFYLRKQGYSKNQKSDESWPGPSVLSASDHLCRQLFWNIMLPNLLFPSLVLSVLNWRTSLSIPQASIAPR